MNHCTNLLLVILTVECKGIEWRVYFGDIPVSTVMVHQWEPQNAARHRPAVELSLDLARAEGEFPSFVWIGPAYLPPRANDYHPPHDVYDGEELVRNVYNGLRANDALWNSSLFIILFDEHGGFYDHVSPPSAKPPDYHREEWTFDKLGVRVPAVLVSPWLPNGVNSDVFDHTSLLKYLIDKWQLGPLGQRAASANTFSKSFLSNPRTDTPAYLEAPEFRPIQTVATPTLTDHEAAMIALSHALESMGGEDAHIIAARSRQVLSGAESQIDAAVDRLAAFLEHKSGLNNAVTNSTSQSE